MLCLLLDNRYIEATETDYLLYALSMLYSYGCLVTF